MAQWARRGKQRTGAGSWCSARIVDGKLQVGLYAWRGDLIADIATAVAALRAGKSFVNVPNDKQFVAALRTQINGATTP